MRANQKQKLSTVSIKGDLVISVRIELFYSTEFLCQRFVLKPIDFVCNQNLMDINKK